MRSVHVQRVLVRLDGQEVLLRVDDALVIAGHRLALGLDLVEAVLVALSSADWNRALSQ